MPPAALTLRPPDREDRLVRDGREVGWSEWGDVAGVPVVYCPGAAMATTFAFGDDAARALGVRLVCVDRAGLGRSAPDPGKSFASWAADVEAVLRVRGVTRPRAVGFSQGAPFAVALAAAGLVSSLALVAATDELAHPTVRPRLVPDVARMIDAIAADAAGFEASFAAMVDADGLLGLVLAMSGPDDRAVFEAPAFAAAYRRAVHAGFAQGPAGYVRDLVLASRPWPTPPEHVTVPVALWYGARDASPVHSFDHGATLATRFPHAARHLVADAGAALLWTHARPILAALLAAPTG